MPAAARRVARRLARSWSQRAIFLFGLSGIVAGAGSAAADDGGAGSRSPRPGETLVATHVSGTLEGSGLAKACDYRTPLWAHEVKPGEYLGLIAGRYGVLREDIIALNPALQANADLIRPGQKLLVCPEIAPTELLELDVKVQPGDTLLRIAAHYELSLDELLAAQASAPVDPDKVRAGQVLKVWVPGAEVPGFTEDELRPPRNHAPAKVSVKLQEGPGYVVKRPHLAYGTEQTVHLLRTVIDRYHRRANGGPAVRVGDISQRGGGKLPPHRSHRHGTDIDVGLIHKGPKAENIRFFHASEEDLDVARTWLLVEEFLKTGKCRYIFLDYELQGMLYEHARARGVPSSRLDEYFQYPRGPRRNHGIIRHWRSHKGHIHVRFR